MKKVLVILFACISCLAASQPLHEEGASIFINVDAAQGQWTISPYINGSHFVYAFESDALYDDSRIVEWMKTSGVNVIRWPGGTVVQHYHWDSLNGIPFKEDSWDPQYNQKAQDPSGYMDVDEFVAYCRKVGAEPMIGVNIRSGKLYNREQESLAEAKRLIGHCKAKGYRVKFWYIGNEGYASGFGVKSYAEYIDQYARALKSVDSDIIIIGDWKFGPLRKNRFFESVEIVKQSAEIDIMEYHEKWGNEWGLITGQTFDDWKMEYPLYNGKLGDYIRRFRHEMDLVGKPDVQIAMNEWGLGNIKNASPFENALIASDYLIEMYRNNIYMGCYWNLNIGDKNSRIFIAKEDGTGVDYFNPVATVFELLGKAPGKQYLNVDCTHKEVYGFATIERKSGNISVYLLNKSEKESETELRLRSLNRMVKDITLYSFVNPGKIEKRKIEYLKSAGLNNEIKITLSPYSFNRIDVDMEF